MNDMKDSGLSFEWTEYYKAFAYFSSEAIRDGCHPQIMEHENADKAIVLTHGLTDSPYYMGALADYFHNQLGYNVYLPLLHYHGLKEPDGMEEVDLKEWKANVRFAINTAAEKANKVSVGGLSTGGTLSFYMACTNPKVTGDLYLFSAALDLAGPPLGFFGEVKERLLRTFLADVLDEIDKDKPLIGKNPYRYSRMDMDGAQELARLIKETDDLLDGYDKRSPFPKRVFAAHSECDTTADIQGIRILKKKTPEERFTFYVLPEKLKVRHAGVPQKVPVRSIDGNEELEQANPKFEEMLEAINHFEPNF